MAAEDLPLVSTVRFDAFVTPPPVVMMPPEPSPVVVIVLSEIMTVVPSPSAPFFPPFPPYENTPLAPSASEVMFAPVIVVVDPSFTRTAALRP